MLTVAKKTYNASDVTLLKEEHHTVYNEWILKNEWRKHMATILRGQKVMCFSNVGIVFSA